MPDRYFLTIGDEPEKEVTKKEYIRAEQSAGFRSKFGPDEVATASFSNSRQGISGSIEYAVVECPAGCNGCSCHVNPPCSHCVEGHGLPEVEG